MKRTVAQVTVPLRSEHPPVIVGIGASAGGLEALELFFRHVPVPCGIAFVVVQHLAPHHSGNLAELLQRCTTMSVQQVVDNSAVQPDCVYVIPPNKDLTVSGRVLHLGEPQMTNGLHLPIDTLLRSLATDGLEQSVGVILSGMGADGSLGLCAVKEQGGVTLAQEPGSAKFASMPKSAIDAGYVDIIAPPEELPGHIISILGSAAPRWRAEQSQRDLEASSFEKITTLLKAKTRHDFSQYKPSSVYRRIERRMGIHRIASMAEYADFMKGNSHEVELLFKELLIGVTSFFRDAAMWEELKHEVFPALLAAYPEGGQLRAWSCGCSTGEEAYSLAMIFSEAVAEAALTGEYRLQIFATDLDSDAVEKARKGVYSSAIEADVSPERLQRFFSKEDNKYRIGKEIREMVTIAQQNVIMDPPFTKLDLLICRNLLIYLSAELQKKLMPLFHYSLKPGGVLFLGSAESIGQESELFAVASARSKQYWRTNVGFNSVVTFPMSLPTSLHQESLMLKSADNLQLLADRLILQHFSAPTVLVNDQGDIVYISGRTGKYLEPAAGKANMNIFAMAREELRYPLGSAFSQVAQQQTPLTVRVETDAKNEQAVDMTLIRIDTPEALRGMVMIAFRDVVLPPKAKRRRFTVGSDTPRVEELELELMQAREELRSNREEMQSAQEELKSANEELQSTNEELQSTNEELTTSKEEMQSMNEELQTVNAEQAGRLNEFMQVSNDMENLLNSTEIVTVFLDNQLQVRRFTTGANRLFKLIPGDVGRPLTDIVSNLEYPQLYEHVQDVLRKLISVENQVTTHDGRWFLVRIMPYRTMDKMIDGVVITCNDITSAKIIEENLRREIDGLTAQVTG